MVIGPPSVAPFSPLERSRSNGPHPLTGEPTVGSPETLIVDEPPEYDAVSVEPAVPTVMLCCAAPPSDQPVKVAPDCETGASIVRVPPTTALAVKGVLTGTPP